MKSDLIYTIWHPQNLNIDCVKTYFQILVITPIHGEIPFEMLSRIRDKTKANVGYVSTFLGGGTLGYLSLILSPIEYSRVVPGTPFVHPLNPERLVIPPGTAHMIYPG